MQRSQSAPLFAVIQNIDAPNMAIRQGEKHQNEKYRTKALENALEAEKKARKEAEEKAKILEAELEAEKEARKAAEELLKEAEDDVLEWTHVAGEVMRQAKITDGQEIPEPIRIKMTVPTISTSPASKVYATMLKIEEYFKSMSED